MSQLRLQKRDDPLAISQAAPTQAPHTADRRAEPSAAPPPAQGRRSKGTAAPARRRTTRRRASTAAAAPSASVTAAPSAGRERTYDGDRLEQTGWRIYESLLAEVKARADELTAAGIPTSAAALAAATLHSRLPRTVDDGAEVMRAYRQATASRQRAGRRSPAQR